MNLREKHKKNARAETISVATALVLVAVKGVIGFFSGSLALIASAVDSFLDSIVSLVNFFTLRAAAKPPDTSHPYGHGKFEAFSEFFQGILVGSSGVFLALESVKRFLNPQEIFLQQAVLGVMIFSLVATFLLVSYLKKVFRQTGSLVIKADSAHYSSDLLSNIAIISGLAVVTLFDAFWLDAVLSFAISLLILASAFELLLESFHILTDHEIDKEQRKKIEDILNAAQKPVTGWHLLRTRRSGTQIHIDFHLVFNDTISLMKAHDEAEKIEKNIQKEIPNAVLLVHLDPHDDKKSNIEMIKKAM
jgi:ferrous-iron efflux pump FieF